MNPTQTSLRDKLIRNFNDAPLKPFVREPLYQAHTASLSTDTAAQKLAARVITLAPGKMSCPYHLHHAQEEMFVVLEGSGTLRVAGEKLPIRAGDTIFTPPGPEYPHHIINTSDAPLRYLAISTNEQPEICEYPDSGKYLAESVRPQGGGFEVIQRAGAPLDYWDGEP
jgi:uncharacterized cupin superfamily protein